MKLNVTNIIYTCVIILVVSIGTKAVAQVLYEEASPDLPLWYQNKFQEVLLEYDEKTGFKQELYNGLYEVNVYESPTGYGFEVVTYDTDYVISYAYGPEFESRTKEIYINKSIATSTELSI